MLEPSAGTGLLAVFAKLAGASLLLNERDPVRAGLLAQALNREVARHDAEYIDDLLVPGERPTVVLINPPFARSEGRGRDPHAGARHLRSALARLAPRGRCVAIMSPAFAHDGSGRSGYESVAALVPRAELEGEMGDHHVGLHARLMSQALRKLTSSIARSNCLVIFINQIRLKIGVMFGNPETTTGGNALKFYASVRLDIRRIGAIKDRDEVVGNQTRVKVVKNKVAAPFRTIEFDIMYGEGISKMGELLDLGVAAGIVDKSGAWISYNGQRIGQGRENAKAFLRENPELANEIESAIRQNAGLVGDQLLDNSIAESEAAQVPVSPDLPE